ncbi:TonB-dependent receptor plug domain-containing protein, partial [candidate division WOR-3 bacterium]|nr:TonB-dependent receptor plug domain-containing protein [candidate division WOR-3 bacterium]MBD3364149.1 TonB-dependent receptor plug domain-containing protein [candidate division WOR-3 bacterium]
VTEGQKLRRDFSLETRAVGVEGVEITAVRARFEHEVDVGVKRMDFTQMRQIPGFVEQDLFRSLEMLPGVISVSDYTAALYIRGGTADQNLILLDGVTVYNPYHLLGFFSTFILESLKGAELYTGGFPAEYGGAVSSVLDVQMKAGNSERVAGSAEIGLLTSKAVIEGPLPWGKGSWLFAGRRTYIDLVTWSLDKIFAKAIENSGLETIYLPYHFYDLNAKVNWDASERSRFTVSGFFGDDVLNFDFEDESGLLFRWGNGTLGARWRYLFTPQLFSVLAFNASRYRIASDISETWSGGSGFYEGDSGSATYTLKSGIGELGLQWRLSWFPSPLHTLEFGLEGKGIEIGNSYEESGEQFNPDSTWRTVFINQKDTFWLASAYLQDKWEPTPLWVIEAGVRGDYFSSGSYLRVSPRLGIKRRITVDWAVKAGTGLYYQYFYVPMPRDEMMLKMPIQFFQQWTAVDERYPPLQSVLLTLGTEHLMKNDMSVSGEVYYKDLRNLREGDPFGGDGPFADTADITPGQGYSYGAEVLFKYRDSWLGYSYSLTRYRFGEGDWYYPLHDSRHNLNFSLALPLGKKGWEFTSAWVFSSGFPFTAQVGWHQYVGEDDYITWIPISGEKGGYRYPAYHRLDVGFTKSFKMFSRYDAEFYVQVLNAYARRNVLFYEYDEPDEDGITEREPMYMLPVPIPSIGIRARF